MVNNRVESGMDNRNKGNRRELFKKGFSFLGRVATEFASTAIEAEELVEKVDDGTIPVNRARGILRPPGAVREKLFNQLCDNCGDCIKACPENVLFPAPASFGPEAQSPMLHPPRKACFLCNPLHCVEACKCGALKPPGDVANINMGKARIDPARCLATADEECGYCVDFCPLSGTAIIKLGNMPVIQANGCVGCGLCEYYCHVKTGANAITTIPKW